MKLNNIEELKLNYEKFYDEACEILDKRNGSIKLNYDEFRNTIEGIVSFSDDGSFKKIKVFISLNADGELLECSCFRCGDDNCVHKTVAALALNNNFKQIFRYFNIKISETATNLIQLFRNNNTKELCNISIILSKMGGNKSFYYDVSLKIGNKKQYILRKNINEFLECYHDKTSSVFFGKDFTYDPNCHFFNSSDKKVIEALPYILTESNSNYNRKFNFETDKLLIKGSKIKLLFKMLHESEKSFTLNDKTTFRINKIDSSFYPLVEINKTDDNLILSMPDENISPLCEDYSYILYNSNVYFLPPERATILNELRIYKNIIVAPEEAEDFNKYVLPNIRHLTDNIVLDDDLEGLYNFNKPIIKLYFDITHEGIVCAVKATYGENEVNILEEDKYQKYNIIKDDLEETEAIDYITSLKFIQNKNYFYITDDEDAIKFIDEDIKKLDKYETFITDKLRDTKYIKRTGVKSTVALESGELLTCNFEVDNVGNDELKKVLEAIKYKKKYYKLKNGSYLNLEDNKELEQMNNFMEALDINYNDLDKNVNFKIPKFKALYISSKKENVDFIQTDNNFDSFIDNYKKAKNKKITIPTPNNATLRDYQDSGVKWMINIANYGFGGILADEMGLGKTLQTIMYTKSRLEENKNREILIVCPTSLIYNWEAEFKKYAPDINVKVIAEIRKKREKIFNELKDYEVFITSYGLLREDIEKYKEIHYDTMIIDEAQAIKNTYARISSSVKEVNADVKFALTGTPIENSLLELFSIFDFIMPGFFGSLANFQDKYGKANPEVIKELNKLITPFILRRKKKDVIKELPDKMERNVIVELGAQQKKIYLSELKKIKDEFDKNVQDGNFNKNKLVILQYLTRLRQLCISPSLYIEDYEGESAKIELLIDTLKEVTEEHKVLIFSQFTSALALVKEQLQKENIDYYYLDGQTKAKDRINLVNDFNKGNTKVFLISLKAGGNGLNLTSADIVIHLDPWWNPAVENQATDRAHRIGQKKVVEVIKLLTKGTIEEKIIKLQEMKKELANQIIEGKTDSDAVLSKLNEEDIKYILSTE